ncbi:MAG: hypothetical protein J0649_12170 [Methylococcales bacterium]|nr:hypothetical protein [Methylococcales bacterium]
MTTTMKRSINVNELDLGDVVYAARAILNDGSMPEGDENNSFVLGNPIGCWDEDLTIH